jgi:nitroreductase
MEKLKKLCQDRHSVRSFTSQEVTDEVLKEILEVTRLAPSAGNLQAYEIVVVKDKATRVKLAHAAYGQRYIAEAPVVLVFLALPTVSSQRYGSRGINLYAIQDATIACTYTMLAAQASGLATTWIGAYDDAIVLEILNADNDKVPAAILPLGYAKEEPYVTSRRQLPEFVQEI